VTEASSTPSRGVVAGRAAARAVVAVGALALVVGIVLSLSTPGRATLGTNGRQEQQFVRIVGPHGKACQRPETVPARAGRVRLRIGTYGPPGPDLTLRFTDHGRLVTSGTLPAGWVQGDIEVPIRPIARTSVGDRLCIENSGGGRLALAGNAGIARTDYLDDREQSWWARFGMLRDRFSQGKSTWYGGWSLPAALLLILASAALTVAIAVRRVR
jgi:hypothetical protein